MDNELIRIELPSSSENENQAICVFYKSIHWEQKRMNNDNAVKTRCEMFKPVSVEKIHLFYTGFTIRFYSGSMLKLNIKPAQVEKLALLSERCNMNKDAVYNFYSDIRAKAEK